MSLTPTRLQMLMHYTAWANALIYASVAALPDAALVAPTPVFAGSILRTLQHVHLIDAVWKAHLTGRPHPFTTRNPKTSPSLMQLCAAQREVDDWYVRYARTLRIDAAAEVVAFTFIGGGEGAMCRGDILLHVANHTSYHRGHLTAMLYPLGVTPPATDLPVYLSEIARAGTATPD